MLADNETMKTISILSLILLMAVLLNACARNSGGSSFPMGEGSNGASGGGGSSDGNSPTPGGPVADFKLSCEEARFVRLINIYRTSLGRAALAVSKAGVISSRWHAQDMIDKGYFSHTEPNGRSFSTRANSFGYGAHAENIAAGNVSASGTFCQWKNSPGHNSNMLGGHVTMGIGNALGGGYGSYWSNNFSGSDQGDSLAQPLTLDADCVMPTALPGC